MAVCYLFANYEVQYKCKYNITKDFIEVETDYDIEDFWDLIHNLRKETF